MRQAWWGVVLGAVAAVQAAPPAAPTFQELMSPDLFPAPQRGLTVEQATLTGDALAVRTTGAEIRLDGAAGQAVFRQRIGHQRELVRLGFGQPLRGARLTHSTAGLARATYESPAVTVRVNGDSLAMLHVHQPLTITVERRFEPGWHASFGANHLVADEWGAFGLYCSQRDLDDRFEAWQPTVATYALPADAVLWVAVCPPKPYDWEHSLRDHVVWHWSRETSYPDDATLRAWREFGNTVLLQSEVMLWKDWNLDFVPRLGLAEFARVRQTIHDAGMRFIVYTSPYYFLRGTRLEPRAFNSFEGFTSWPPGTPTGENMELFLTAIRRVMTEYQPDGLYFDGQYTDNPAALYALARRAREIVGEQGLLEWHSTHALGPNQCSLPPADAYLDYLLRGEGQGARYADFDYLRYFVSGYNVSNTVGVLCNNAGAGPTPELIAQVLRANARLHTIVGWTRNEQVRKTLREAYHARLTPALRTAVDAGVDERQAQVAAKAERRRAELVAIQAPPQWGEPVSTLDFPQLPQAAQEVSPRNPAPFAVAGGTLHITGLANTYAYLKLPVTGDLAGFEVKLRQGTDGGQSWGPGAWLKLASGATLRLGTRSDRTLQADLLGAQQHGGSYDPSRWVWLRSRWLETLGVVERSDDGLTWAKLWTFEHGGSANSPAVELRVGKVPWNGQPQDYSVAGDPGESEIAWVKLYGRP